MKLSNLKMTDAPLSYGATAVYPLDAIDLEKYTFTSRFEEEVPLYRVDGNVIHLPRALCPVGYNDNRDPGDKVAFPKTPTPKPNQKDVFDATAKALKQGISGIVVAYTGWGKTVLGYFAAAVLGVKTLVITTKSDIYKQWRDDAPKFLGIDPSEVGEIRGPKYGVEGKKFVVAMIHSLSKPGKYPSWITKGFGLVIFDECHRLPAEQFQNVAGMFPAAIRLGLSATPERSDGKEIVFYAHIGTVIAETEGELMIPKVLRYHSGWKCPLTLQYDPVTGEKRAVKIPHQPGKTTHIEKIIAANPERNEFCAELIHACYQKGRMTIVFSTLIDHLHSLQRQMHKLGVTGKDMGLYVHASTKAEIAARDKVIARPILFTTYGMMGEGTNFPWFDTCLLAMPRAKVTQPVGRIRREYEDKKFPTVLDILDGDSAVFGNYASARKKWYASIGCEVKDMN